MRNLSLLMIVVVTCALPHSDLLAAAPEETLIAFPFKGTRYALRVSEGALEKTPLWNAAAENPPLAAAQALQLAIPLQEKFLKDTDAIEWKLRGIILKHNGRPDALRRWYWVVHYEMSPKPNHGLTGAIDFYGAVLMDGTVVEPLPTKARRIPRVH